MVLSGGGRDALEAVRKRLTAANSQTAAAKQMLDHAQSMYEAAEKERKDAKAALNEAEKKYEVIDIDDEPETPTVEGSNKRRKVSLSPQANNDLQRDSNNSTARNNTLPMSISFAAGSSSSNAFSNNLNNNPITMNELGYDQVVVSACGYPGVSGIYKQENGSLYEGAPVFTKRVRSTTFAIYRVPSSQKFWYIGHWNINTNSELPSSRLFKSNLYTRESNLIPPDEGWVSCSATLSSQEVPECRFLSNLAASSAAATRVNELVVSGCGVPLANGKYKRTNRTFQGLPRYTKEGQITFTISSVFNDKQQQWKIYQKDSKSLYKCKVSRRVGGKLDGAPLDNSTWRLTNDGIGVLPPPHVRRG